MNATLTANTASFIAAASVPQAVRDKARKALVDTVGVILSGARSEVAPPLAGYVRRHHGAGNAVVPGTALATAPEIAAFVNGTFGHALDFDDGIVSAPVHPSAVVISALLGAAQDIDGRTLLDAYVIGVEVAVKLATAIGIDHYHHGWHGTGTIGVFGAVAALARARRLDAMVTRTAFGLAASMTSGIQRNFGTMTKPLHVGVCGHNGLYAALLAREGFTAHPEAFEHKQGFFELFNGAGNYDAAKAVTGWANPLDILNPGVGLKQYPCCASTHSAIDAMIILKQKYDLTPENVARIETVTHERALVHTNRPQPNSTLDAKFSVQYCVARALMHGDVKFDHFEGDTYRDPSVRKLLERVTASTHAHKAKGMRDHYEGKVRVTTADGRVLEAEVALPLRGPTNLAPPDRLTAKFNDCAARVLRPEGIERVLGLMNRFETLDDTRQLTDAMSEAVKGSADQRVAA